MRAAARRHPLAAAQAIGGYFLGQQVDARLASISDNSQPSRLVWVLLSPDMKVVPTIGGPTCEIAYMVVDAVSGDVLWGGDIPTFE